MATPVSYGRQAGILLPLFSCPSARSWGIGEIGDIPAVAAWMLGAGLRLWQVLPVNEMAPGQNSPYSAISAMAIDPIYVSLERLPDFQALGGEDALDTAMRGVLAHVRSAAAVDYESVRTIKDRALRNAFARFLDAEWARDSARASALRAFSAAQAWWLADYALFRAIRHVSDGRPWTAWDPGARDGAPGMLARLRSQLAREVLFREYLQWVAHEQWQAARIEARGIRLFGDLPFMVASDSADVWARQQQFSFDGTVGAPPDAFSATGQNWGLPIPRWDAMRADRFGWFRARARRAADLFDGFRVDHVVGLFRTWVFPLGESPRHFLPADEPAQIEQGEAVLRALDETDGQVIAEDLGTVPDFVRETLQRLGLPGFKVLRWEREWNTPGQPFSDPIEYPANSVATSGTHDTETLAAWWDSLTPDERARVFAIPRLAAAIANRQPEGDDAFSPEVRDALLELLFASGSDLLMVPVQDLFGWTARINVPAVIDGVNWTWRLPWPVDRLDAHAEAVERQATLARWSAQHRRG